MWVITVPLLRCRVGTLQKMEIYWSLAPESHIEAGAEGRAFHCRFFQEAHSAGIDWNLSWQTVCPNGLGRSGHWLTCYVGAKREVNAQRYSSSGQVNHHRHIEFRTIPLHVPSSVLLSKFRDPQWTPQRPPRSLPPDGNGDRLPGLPAVFHLRLAISLTV